jgi:predicted transposase YdaD
MDVRSAGTALWLPGLPRCAQAACGRRRSMGRKNVSWNSAPAGSGSFQATCSGGYNSMEGTVPNRLYKDRLFKAVFGQASRQSSWWRLDLYNALNDTDYKNPNDLTLTTIENVIYITMKNDVSFLVGSQMNLYEQQSTFNPNMPLRGLMYFAQLYQIYLSNKRKDLLGSRLVKIPAPSFIVFYNGDRTLSDVSYQRLSDAFEPKGSTEGFEWTAKVINIGGGHNETLHKKCKALYDYSSYVNRVKVNLKAGMTTEEAVRDALDFAIKNHLLNGFFKRQKMEVLNMSLTEFDQEEYDRNRREEGYLDGVNDGKQDAARNALALGLPLEQVSQITGLSVEDIQALAASAPEPVLA